MTRLKFENYGMFQRLYFKFSLKHYKKRIDEISIHCLYW
ncbi:hypothetical protein LEP1GSC060_2998 [Leptospira weilii serovar Ranarum str. ICFT]|uniref:Uncharacterized protein n=1 Tax=Leptospira weilii serovar Ranarum str. ICFT TaxID=1218598 RepID=N1WNS9_9LEPT|nr:hypothetical protein LEP1GSC060_2998 [Leptospira weilii serovar Ranarum str. ICFT]